MPRNPNHECHVCSKSFYIKPSVLAKSKSGNAFCSSICYGKHCQKLTPCAVCGKEILSSKNAKTCSKACANKQKIGTTYKQIGKSTKDAVRDNRAIRKRLVEYVGKESCQRCGYDKIPQILHAHHIIERCKGGTDDLSNLELLCPTCHLEEHWIRKQK